MSAKKLGKYHPPIGRNYTPKRIPSNKLSKLIDRVSARERLPGHNTDETKDHDNNQ